MAVRFWLNAKGEKATEAEQEKKFGEMKDVSYLDDLEVRDEKGGAKYIDLYIDPLDPASSMPSINRKYVKRVTFVGTYHEGFRTNGIYKHKGATARVETVRSIHHAYSENDRSTEETYQKISISAGSVKTLREIYSKVRKGELMPDEDWGASEYELERRKHLQTIASAVSAQQARAD